MQAILRAHVPTCTVWAFGSRTRETAKFTSDLDLAVDCKAPLPPHALCALQDAFEESSLPMKVDLLDLGTATESFRRIVNEHKVLVQDPVA